MHTDPESITPRVRILQFVIAALTAGCAGVLTLMYFLHDPQAGQQGMQLVTPMALAASGGAVLARLVVPRFVVAAGRQRLATQDPSTWTQGLLNLYQTRTIIAAALLEGMVFFLAAAYMLEGRHLALAMGIALTLAVAAHFPTSTGVAGWIDDQQQEMRQEGLLRREP